MVMEIINNCKSRLTDSVIRVSMNESIFHWELKLIWIKLNQIFLYLQVILNKTVNMMLHLLRTCRQNIPSNRLLFQ